MNLQILVVVIIRLMALNFFIDATVRLAPQLLRLTSYSQNAYSANLDVILAMPWLVVIGLVCGAVLFWVFALPIARLVTMDLPAEISLGALSLADGYAITFVAVGLCYMAGNLAPVLNLSYFLIRLAAIHEGQLWREQVMWPQVLQAFVPFIVGILLFVNGRKWAIALAQRQGEVTAAARPLGTEPNSESKNP